MFIYQCKLLNATVQVFLNFRGNTTLHIYSSSESDICSCVYRCL